MHFPSTLNVSDVQLLIQNPYVFYLKIILKLEPVTNPETDNQARLFSLLLKEILALHSICGQSFDKLLQSHHVMWAIPQHTASIWLKLFQMIEKSYLSFIHQRNPETLYCFKRFELGHKLHTCEIDRVLNVKCRVDRLELYPAINQIHVMRYQTRSLPTQKQNKDGESFLLIACALVLLHNSHIQWDWSTDYSWHVYHIRINKGRLEQNDEVFTKLQVYEIREKLLQTLTHFLAQPGRAPEHFKARDLFYNKQYQHIARKK